MFLQPDAVVRQLFQKLYFLPGMRVCDIGCGGGYFAALLAEKLGPEGRVYAIDIQEDAVKETQELAHLLGFRTIICALENGQHTSFENNFFQAVFLSQLRVGEKNGPLILKEAKRIVQRGGVIAIVEQEKNILFSKVQPHVSEEIQKNIKNIGLTLVEILHISDNYNAYIVKAS